MTLNGQPRVLIAGAGPVGLTLAIELARRGVSCRIVDENAGPVRQSRAIAIHARTLEVFSSLGVVGQMLAAGRRIHGASIAAEGHQILHLSFDELDSPYPFALDLAQSDTERILEARLNALGVFVERRTTAGGALQDDESVSVVLRRADGAHENVRVDFVAGCDGAHSTIRHSLRVTFEDESFPETFALADVHIDWDQRDDEWHLWFHDEGMLAAFPLKDGLYRVIADEGEDAAAREDPTLEEMQGIWARRGPKNSTLRDPGWLSRFRIHQRRASQFQQGRVFIAGDAAHAQSPAGGQGMNTGIQDAFNLGWKLALVAKGMAPATLLGSYTAERMPVVRDMLSLTGRLTSLATLRHPISQEIRNRLMPVLAGFEVIEQRLLNRIEEFSVTYRGSPIVAEHGHWHGSGPKAGDRALDALLGEGRRLFDLFLSTRHALLLFAGESPDESDLRNFASIGRYMHDGYPELIETHLISREIDLEGNAHRRYAAAAPCVYLIRPDGYIAFRSLSSDPLPLLAYLNRTFEPD